MFKFTIVVLMAIACASAKPGGLIAAPVAYSAPIVTAHSSQVIARNYNGVGVAAPVIAAYTAPVAAAYTAAAYSAPVVASAYAAAPYAAYSTYSAHPAYAGLASPYSYSSLLI